MKKHFGLIGYPLTHSMLPFIHARLFEASEIDADYMLYSFPEVEFNKYLDTLRTLDGDTTRPLLNGKEKLSKVRKPLAFRAPIYKCVA